MKSTTNYSTAEKVRQVKKKLEGPLFLANAKRKSDAKTKSNTKNTIAKLTKGPKAISKPTKSSKKK
jgi:hypothetical protein